MLNHRQCGFYKNGYDLLQLGKLNWVKDCIKVVLMSSEYTPDAEEMYYSDILKYVVGHPVELTNKTQDGDVLDADDVTFDSLPQELVEYIVMYHDSGCANTSPLIAFTSCGETTLPYQPWGLINVQWSNSESRIVNLKSVADKILDEILFGAETPIHENGKEN